MPRRPSSPAEDRQTSLAIEVPVVTATRETEPPPTGKRSKKKTPRKKSRKPDLSEPMPQSGYKIPNYQIVRKLGEGGMGVVFEAQQQYPERRVALKIIPGWWYIDELAIALYVRETHDLRRLKHPGIAPVYEAGRTPAEQHFFAMELISGVPLTEYRKAHRTHGAPDPEQLRQRLGIMYKICQAVSYAHQRGVIHRGLKPSNVMITVEGSDARRDHVWQGVPDIKVLDFGLARITDAETVRKERGEIRGTFQYMSPEQAVGDPEDCDLRSDVYSLGVMLYELVTGSLPYPAEGKSPRDAARIITEQAARPPSEVWAEHGARMDPDLEAVLVKATQKDPEERYQTALALAGDIERFIKNQPIMARVLSTGYQVRKLIKRHRGPFSVAVIVAALGVLYTAFMTFEAIYMTSVARRAAAEADVSRDVSAFLLSMLAGEEDEGAADGAHEAWLDQAVAVIPVEFADRPLVQAQLMHAIGTIYTSLGRYDDATPLLVRALTLRRSELGEEHEDVAESLRGLANLYTHQGRLAEAEPLLRQSVAIKEKVLGPNHPSLADNLDDYAVWLRETNREEEAMEVEARADLIRSQNAESK